MQQKELVEVNIDKFKLKGYTTGITAAKSITEIEELLLLVGATKIMKGYLGDGTLEHISFQLDTKGYQLPLNVAGVKEVLKNTPKVPRSGLDDQAYRVACRVLRDWLHSQLSIIASGQAEPEQVMLPYMSNGKITVYGLYKSGAMQLENKSGVDE